jgi:hypothetical protein
MGFGDLAEPFIKAARRDLFVLDALDSIGARAALVRTGGTAEGASHVVAAFPGASDSRERPRAFFAHHDRVPGTPGALDNSAACLQLLALAKRLVERPPRAAVLLAFTDAEELGDLRGPAEQGSLALSGWLKAHGWERAACVALDVTGRGDSPFLASPGPAFSRGGPLAARASGGLDDLRRAVSERVAAVAGACPVLPAPYSDDLGLVLGGLPAVALTLLPRAELSWWTAWCAERAGLDEGRDIDPRSGSWGGASRPETWKLLHGPRDDISLLERASFELIGRILDSLARSPLPHGRVGALARGGFPWDPE